jgi:L-fucose mutarotase
VLGVGDAGDQGTIGVYPFADGGHHAPGVAQVLEAILGTVQIDEVHTMGVDRSDSYAAATPGDPPVWAEYRRIIAAAGATCMLEPIVTGDFYEAVASDDHVLTIQTADKAPWANLLLSLGCRTFDTK